MNDIFQIIFGDLIGRDVKRKDLVREFLETVIAPFREEVGGEGGNFFRDEEASVVGEAFEDDFFEGELNQDLVLSVSSNAMRWGCGRDEMRNIRRNCRHECSGSVERGCERPLCLLSP